MLKKSGIIVIVLLYLVTATGFALNLHFCGDNIESVKINTPVKKCGMSSKCCKNTHLEVKVKDAHQSTYTVFTSQILALPVPAFIYPAYQEPSAISHSANLLTERGPPPLTVPVFIKNCVFRI